MKKRNINFKIREFLLEYEYNDSFRPTNIPNGNDGSKTNTNSTPQPQSTPDDKSSMTKVTLILEDL